MIYIPAHIYQCIMKNCEAAYPDEACGLLGGYKNDDGTTVVTCVRNSANVAQARRHDRFEIDPALRFRFMRELEQRSTQTHTQAIIGHYHSHPDHPAAPSETDLAMAYEPDMIWLIAAVNKGNATDLTAHRLIPEGTQPGNYRFQQIRLLCRDDEPYATGSDYK